MDRRIREAAILTETTRLKTRSEVTSLLGQAECINAVEEVTGRCYFAAKVNG